MINIQFCLAGLLALVWLVVHLSVGGREVARPLRNAVELEPLVRDVQYLCWHFTSVSIAAISSFFWLAILLEEHAYAVAGTLLASGFSLVGIGVIEAIGQKHTRAPQGWLFVPIALLGAWGLLAA